MENIPDKVDIPSYLQHHSWRGEVRDVITINQRELDLDQVEKWVVKLTFTPGNGKPGEEAAGSGSFIKIPDCDKTVILTAAHNLIAPNGQKSTNMMIYWGDNDEKEGPISDSNFRICKKYDVKLAAATTPQPATDYGIVILDRRPPVDGFGYSIKLAEEKELNGVVTVTGYKPDTPPGKPIESQGWCRCHTNRLEYHLKTEKGISGSPVWVSLDPLGYPAVIGVQ